MIGWLKNLFAWHTVRNTGTHIYQENTRTGARRVIRISGGLQPVSTRWLEGGEFTNPSPKLPSSGTAVRPHKKVLDTPVSIHVYCDGKQKES